MSYTLITVNLTITIYKDCFTIVSPGVKLFFVTKYYWSLKKIDHNLCWQQEGNANFCSFSQQIEVYILVPGSW